jgi:hypothetical protein
MHAITFLPALLPCFRFLLDPEDKCEGSEYYFHRKIIVDLEPCCLLQDRNPWRKDQKSTLLFPDQGT